MLKYYVPHIHPRIETLLLHHVQPLTIIYPDVQNLPKYAVAENGSSGIRIVQSTSCQEMIKELGHPIVSTSANLAGEPFPRSFEEISKEIIDQVDFIDRFSNLSLLSGEPSVMITYNEKGDINFLRT